MHIVSIFLVHVNQKYCIDVAETNSLFFINFLISISCDWLSTNMPSKVRKEEALWLYHV